MLACVLPCALQEWGKMGRQLGADGSEGGAGVVHYLPVEEAVMEEVGLGF